MLAWMLALVAALALVALGDLRAAAPAAVGVMLCWGAGILALPRPRGEPARVLVAALSVRAVLLWSPPGLSDDLYRYLWEGKAILLGGNPFLHPPAAPSWDRFGPDSIRALVNHAEVSTVYPPLSLLLFALLASVHYGPLSVKLFMGLCDALTAFVLARILQRRGRSLEGAWLYALLPLPVVESAGSGHLDALALLLLVLSLQAWEQGRSGVGWAGLGAMVKLLPGVLLPLLWRRQPLLLGLVGLVAGLSLLPFIEAGPTLLRGLGTYAAHWRFNGSLFPLLELVLGSGARPVAVLIGALVVALALWRLRDPTRVALWAGGAFVLLSPTVHPWYVLWAWVPALLCGVRAWTVLALLAPSAYLVLGTLDPLTGRWEEQPWTALFQYIPFFVALGWEAIHHLLHPGPWAPRPMTRR